MTGFYPSSQHSFLPVCTLYYPTVKHAGNCQPLFFTNFVLRRPLPTFSTSHFSSCLPPPSRLPWAFQVPSSHFSPFIVSKWFSNLPALGKTSNWISKFLPTNREHRISNFALRHDNSQFIPCRAQIVVGLITKTDLVPRVSISIPAIS